MTEYPPNSENENPTPPPYPGQQPYQGQQPYGGQPQQYPAAPQPQYGGAQYGGGIPPKHPQSTTSLVLGIVALVFCQILGPVAWIIGGKAVKEIDASNGTIGGRSEANAGRILGIVSTVILILVVLAFVAIFGLAIFLAATDPEFAEELQREWDAASVFSAFFR